MSKTTYERSLIERIEPVIRELQDAYFTHLCVWGVPKPLAGNWGEAIENYFAQMLAGFSQIKYYHAIRERLERQRNEGNIFPVSPVKIDISAAERAFKHYSCRLARAIKAANEAGAEEVRPLQSKVKKLIDIAGTA